MVADGIPFPEYQRARHKLLRTVDVPEGTSGRWQVARFAVSEDEAHRFNLRQLMRQQGRLIASGTYTRLTRSGRTVMSDTPAERSDHVEPVARAVGRVLVVGMGLGVAVQAMLSKPEVKSLLVMEISSDVIALTADYWRRRFGRRRLEVIQADVMKASVPAGPWDVVWFDIWDDLNSRNCQQMGWLKRRYARCSGWRGCWSQEQLKYLDR